MNWDIELAKEFKKRDNSPLFGAVLGNVISISPLKISILGDKVILESNHCYICNNVNGLLEVGDEVFCLPTTNGQKYFVVDKVVGQYVSGV